MRTHGQRYRVIADLRGTRYAVFTVLILVAVVAQSRYRVGVVDTGSNSQRIQTLDDTVALVVPELAFQDDAEAVVTALGLRVDRVDDANRSD